MYIYKHFDGPLYIIPAKTLYDTKEIRLLNRDSSLAQNPMYFAAHLPLYPLAIRIAAPIFGYLKSMLAVNVVATILLALFLYYVFRKLHVTKHPFILVTVFLFLPRFLVIRTVGAPESLFILLVFISLFFFEKENYFIAGLCGALATMTKTPGILLFAAYGLVFLERLIAAKTLRLSWGWILLIPTGFLAVCAWYGLMMGDFFAYFHSGDNIHLIAPFAVFDFQKSWVGTAWLEDILFYFFLYGLTAYKLRNSKHRSFFYFSLIYWIATLFVQHRDISRYSLPLWPLACIAFEEFFTSQKFKVVSILLLTGVYMYTWNFLLYNIMPINEWLPFL